VTFVYHAKDGADSVGVLSPVFHGSRAPLDRIGDSQLFAASFTMPATTRVSYRYLPNAGRRVRSKSFGAYSLPIDDAEADPLNPIMETRDLTSQRGKFIVSILTLPDARPVPSMEVRPGTLVGATQDLQLRSKLLGKRRRVSVYYPPGYERGQNYPLVVLIDGHQSWWRAQTIFDNLSADRASPPFVAALINQHGCFSPPDAFVQFLVEELVPLLESRFAIGTEGQVIAGAGLGALVAAYAGLRAPTCFSNVITISPPFQSGTPKSVKDSSWWQGKVDGESESLIEKYAQATGPLPRRMYVGVGSFMGCDGSEARAESGRFAEVLHQRGVDVRLDVDETLEDTISARAHLAYGLAWILAPRHWLLKIGKAVEDRSAGDLRVEPVHDASQAQPRAELAIGRAWRGGPKREGKPPSICTDP